MKVGAANAAPIANPAEGQLAAVHQTIHSRFAKPQHLRHLGDTVRQSAKLIGSFAVVHVVASDRSRIRLFGASYGSHLGLSVIRRHPSLVERAVLGAVEGPDQTIKLPAAADAQLDRIGAAMREDAATARVRPTLPASCVISSSAPMLSRSR